METPSYQKPTLIVQRWAEHFDEVLDRSSDIAAAVIDELPQRLTLNNLSVPIQLEEVEKAIKVLKNGKAPGADGLSSEVFKHGGSHLTDRLHLFSTIWER